MLTYEFHNLHAGSYFQITCALKEMFQVEETEEQVAKIYHRLFAALMVRMGASVGVEPLKKQEPVCTVKILKIWTSEKFVVITLKSKKVALP